jgi:hypothetical protein
MTSGYGCAHESVTRYSREVHRNACKRPRRSTGCRRECGRGSRSRPCWPLVRGYRLRGGRRRWPRRRSGGLIVSDEVAVLAGSPSLIGSMAAGVVTDVGVTTPGLPRGARRGRRERRESSTAALVSHHASDRSTACDRPCRQLRTLPSEQSAGYTVRIGRRGTGDRSNRDCSSLCKSSHTWSNAVRRSGVQTVPNATIAVS